MVVAITRRARVKRWVGHAVVVGALVVGPAGQLLAQGLASTLAALVADRPPTFARMAEAATRQPVGPVANSPRFGAPKPPSTADVDPVANLVVTKTGPALGRPGLNVGYTVGVRNDGPSPARNVVATDTLPSGATFVSASGGGNHAGGVVTWPTVATLATGASLSFTVTVRYPAVGIYTNIAAASSPTADPALPNRATTTTTIGDGPADVVTTKSGPATAAIGQNISYTITARNTGPNPARQVVVTDTIPAGLTFVSATGGGSASANVVTWPAIPALGIGSSQTFTVVAVAAAAGTFTNIAASTSARDPTPGNNDGSAPAARVTTVVPASANLASLKSGPATGVVGQDLTYTVGVINAGPSPAATVVVTDTVPPGMTFVSATGGGTFANGVVTWPAIASLASGGSASFTVTLRATVAGTFVNRVAAGSATPDPNPADNDGSAPASQTTTVVGPSADVSTTKTGPATATVGANVVYTISTINNGPSAAQSVAVTDTLPIGAVFVSATNGGVAAGNVVTWPTVASLANGANLVYSVTVQFAAPGVYLDIAANASPTPDPNPGNNDGSNPAARVTTVVGPAPDADVVATKTGPAAATAGQNIGYTITVTNNGPSAATGVVATDTLPAGVTFVSASAGGSLAGNVVTWPTLPSLANGATATFTVTIRAATAGTYVDIAAATGSSPDPNLANNRAVATTLVPAASITADVATTKTGPATVAPGGTLVYTIQVTNSGPDAAAVVVVTDTLPIGVTFVSATGSPSLAGNVLTWPTIASLASGASVTFSVTVTAPASGTLTNIAASTASTTDPNPANNNGSTTSRVVTVVIQPSADLETTKTGPATAAVGAAVTYTVTTRNLGPGPAVNVQVIDSVPAGTQFVSATDGGVFANGVVTWPVIASLASGGTITRSVTLILGTAGSITNVARSTSGTPDPDPVNNRGTTTTTVSATADVVTTKTGPATVAVGGQIPYTIVAKNLGPSPALGVVVIDSLPIGVTFVSASNGGTAVGRVVTWPPIASLAVGDSVVYTLVVTAPSVGATLINVVTSTATTQDPEPDNNDGSDPKSRVETEVIPVDLAIVKSHTGDLIAGTVATYTLVVSNVGPTPTIGPIVVTDTLPAGLTFESAGGPGWNCANAGQVVTCQYDAVGFAPGASTTITLRVQVALDAPATIINRAHVSTPSDTEDTGNNVSTDSATVSRVSPITIEKVASKADAEIGDVVDYTVLVANRGSVMVTDVTVTDVLPKGFSYQRGTARVDLIPIADPAGAPGPTLTFAIGDLGPNSQVRLSYRVKVGAGATLGDGANRAKAKSGTGLESGEAVAVVRVRGGVFTDRGIIVGKVFLECDCDSTRRESRYRSGLRRDSLGVPGVRLFLEDGSSVVTDFEGNYNFVGLVSGLHVVKVDPTTLPRGARLTVLDSRNAGDSSSRFVDLKYGELHKADFAIRYADSVRGGIDLRRERGDVLSAIIDSIAGIVASDTLTRPFRAEEVAERDRPVQAVDGVSDTLETAAYRPLAAETSANPIDEANRLPMRRLPGTTVPLTAVPNGSIELVPARRSLPADGNTAMAVRVRVLDLERRPIAAEQPVTLETSLGRWLESDLDPVEPGVQAVLASGEGTFTLVASAEAGVGEIRVTNGLRVSTVRVAFVPAERPLFVNGLVEARIDLRSLLRDGLLQVTSADRFERELKDLRVSSDDGKVSAAARGALFLQGKVKGATLLTLAYDTERDPERRMFRDIQPEEFYPVYGDASIKEFGAQSFDRLYVRVDNQRSFALYGDYVTPAAGLGALAVRELGAYQRSLTGALVHGENGRGQVNVFASRDRLTQVVEEIPGRGISGPYQLGRLDGRLNSEKVEILTRDRNQPSRILAATPMSRFTDYSLEPFTGRLLFFTPVPSVDADLNPVSIRVLYEVERSGEDFWVYGADGQLRIGDRLEVGGGVVRDDQPSSNRRLYSANAAVALGSGTVLLTEFARTGGDSAGFRGDAARFELRHASAKVQGSIFGATSDAGFSNQSSTFQAGRTELGLRGSAAIDDRTRLLGEALRTEDRVGGGRRTGFLAGFERQIGKFVRAELGYRFAEERGGAASEGTAVTPGATPNETNAIRTRLTVQIPGQPRASVFGEFEQDVAESDQRRGAFGGQYVLFDRLRLYGRHEFLSSFAGPFAFNGAQRQATTVIGLDAGYTKDGQFFGEYRGRDAFSGRETEAAIGLRNRWNLAKGLVVNTGFERVDVLKGTGVGEATAITAGVEYTTSPNWRGTARFEYRFAPNGDDLLATLGYVRKLERDWTLLGRVLYNTFGDGGKRRRNQIGLAWRETDGNRWNGLARWENRFQRLPTATGDAIEESDILSAHLNYQPAKSIWLSGRFAGKWAFDESVGLSTATEATLVSVRGLFDFAPRWDAGVIASVMWSGGRQHGIGFELGRAVVKNFRAAIGYNIFGFRDGGLVGDGSQTDRGLYLHFGFKFDEDTFRHLAGDSRRR
jgi:uncharacterized repeat protein (TIGR01451 family)